MKKRVLGTRVDLVTREESLVILDNWLNSPKIAQKVVVTAYSEFFVTAMRREDFRMALEGADLVTPDGIGPLAAIYFDNILRADDGIVVRILKGLRTGGAVLSGKVGQPVSGYWLFKTLSAQASANGWKVFLLGGFGDTAEKLATKLKSEYSGLQIESDRGAQNEREMEGEANTRVIAKINQFKPDLLFVAYGPVKQEIWMTRHKKEMKCKVAMGVGGAFDEALGLVKEAPVAFSKFGLKWFWRLLQQPQRLPRIFKATVLFACLVFIENLRKK